MLAIQMYLVYGTDHPADVVLQIVIDARDNLVDAFFQYDFQYFSARHYQLQGRHRYLTVEDYHSSVVASHL